MTTSKGSQNFWSIPPAVAMDKVPASPGIYVVSLSNEQPISVNADRGNADRCIFVTKKNCKYGRAVNLARRYRDYIKTFGIDNVIFEVVVLTDFPEQLESTISSRLSKYRIRGRTRRPNEWLEGITSSETKKIIIELAASQTSFIQSPDYSNSSVKPSEVIPSNFDGCKTLDQCTAQAIRDAADYLQVAGMSVKLLKDMHHSSARTETYASTIRYFNKDRELRAINIAYGKRLCFVAKAHQEHGESFETLVAESLVRFPRNT